MSARRAQQGRRRTRGGFTLIETGVALVIISVGLLAVMQAQRAFLVKNAWSSNAATAGYLADEIRERTRAMPRHDRFAGGLYFTDPDNPATLSGWGPEPDETSADDLDDLDDFDGAVFGNATNFPAGFTMTRRYPGPIDALAATKQSSRWQKGSIRAPASIETPGPKTTFWPITTSWPIRVS